MDSDLLSFTKVPGFFERFILQENIQEQEAVEKFGPDFRRESEDPKFTEFAHQLLYGENNTH